MSEPEISHRCPSCGASIRTRAQFCPQCGKPLKKSVFDALPETPEESPLDGMPEQELKTTPLPPVSNLIETPQSAAQNVEEQVAVAAGEEHLENPAPVVAVPDESNAKKHRVRDAARGVQENVRPRVEKLRHASSVVLEEVAIDPSLRFILIAILLFIIALVLLMLSFIK